MATFVNALGAYTQILRELDKYEAPSFERLDFIYWFNKSIKQYCNKRYELFDTEQQHIDDLRAIVLRTAPALALTNRVVALPADYWHMLKVKVNFTYVTARGCHSAGETFQRTCKRLTADLQGFIADDYYQRPTPDRVYYKVEKNNVFIHFDEPNNPITYVVANTAELEYLQVPGDVDLPALNVPGTVLNSGVYNAQFPDYVWQEIANLCVTLFLEWVEQQRIATQPPVNKTIT